MSNEQKQTVVETNIQNSVSKSKESDDQGSIKTSKSKQKDVQSERKETQPELNESTMIKGESWADIKKKLVDPSFDRKAFVSQLSDQEARLFIQLSKEQVRQANFDTLQQE